MLQCLLCRLRNGYDAVFHGLRPVEVNRQEAILQSQDAEHRLDGTRGTRCMPRERLGRRHWRHVFAEEPHHGVALAGIVVGRARAMRIDVVDVRRLQPSQRQRLAHRTISPFAIRRRGGLMERIASVAIARKQGLWRHASTFCTFCRFQDKIGCTFAQIQSVTCGVEGTTRICVEDHQRVETVEMKLCDALAATYYHDVGFSAAYHVGTQYDSIGR